MILWHGLFIQWYILLYIIHTIILHTYIDIYIYIYILIGDSYYYSMNSNCLFQCLSYLIRNIINPHLHQMMLGLSAHLLALPVWTQDDLYKGVNPGIKEWPLAGISQVYISHYDTRYIYTYTSDHVRHIYDLRMIAIPALITGWPIYRHVWRRYGLFGTDRQKRYPLGI